MIRNGKAYLKGEGANLGVNNSVYWTVIIKIIKKKLKSETIKR